MVVYGVRHDGSLWGPVDKEALSLHGRARRVVRHARICASGLYEERYYRDDAFLVFRDDIITRAQQPGLHLDTCSCGAALPGDWSYGD